MNDTAPTMNQIEQVTRPAWVLCVACGQWDMRSLEPGSWLSLCVRCALGLPEGYFAAKIESLRRRSLPSSCSRCHAWRTTVFWNDGRLCIVCRDRRKQDKWRDPSGRNARTAVGRRLWEAHLAMRREQVRVWE